MQPADADGCARQDAAYKHILGGRCRRGWWAKAIPNTGIMRGDMYSRHYIELASSAHSKFRFLSYERALFSYERALFSYERAYERA